MPRRATPRRSHSSKWPRRSVFSTLFAVASMWRGSESGSAGAFDRPHPSRVQVTTERREGPAFDMELVGDHQAANAALVVAAVEELRRQGLYIPDVAVAGGLAQVRWPARLEAVGHAPLVLLDCAHNVASAQALLDTLQASFPLQSSGRRILIFASSRDKDVAGML